MATRKIPVASAAIASLIIGSGCVSPTRPPPFDPIPMHQAVQIVNRNAAGIGGTLKAGGSVDGRFVIDGRTRNYHVDAVLFYLNPCYVRFEMKKLGNSQFLLGSNDKGYWYRAEENDPLYCGQHGAPEDLPAGIPIRPDQIADALGLSPITGANASGPLVQRIVDEYQQVLFLEHDESGHPMIEKEYWLDRYPPQLIRRVVFRDLNGAVEMESRLDDYRPLTPNGPLLPHAMAATWPKEQTEMWFRVAKWTLVERVTPDSRQFATPQECDER